MSKHGKAARVDRPIPESITFHVTNLASRDASFLSQIIGLFCDQAKSGMAQDFRSGCLAARYHQPTGQLILVDHTRKS